MLFAFLEGAVVAAAIDVENVSLALELILSKKPMIFELILAH